MLGIATVTIMLVVLVMLLATVCHLVAEKRKKLGGVRIDNVPEGPPGLPLIGNLHLFRWRTFPSLHQTMYDWVKEYGSVYTLKIGPKIFYVLNGFDCITSVFSNPHVQGRNPFSTFIAALGKGAGPATATGESWISQRSFALKYFAEAASGMEKAVTDEVVKVLTNLSNTSPKSPVNMEKDIYRLALYGILCKVTFGKAYDYEDEEFRTITDVMDTVFQNSGPAGMFYSLQKAVSLPFGKPALLAKKAHCFKVLLEKLIKERRLYLAENPSSPSCYLDAYIMQQHITSNSADKSELNPHFKDDNLMWAIFEMFFGGTNIPNNALSSILVYLINNPEVQKNCQSEIDNVLGNEIPKFADRHRLPYLQATIAECLRLANVTPLGIPRLSTNDVSIGGYVIPKGSLFMSNLQSIMMDPEVFLQPETFRPERFLDESGSYHRPKELVPFGVGSRACLGEQLAWMEMFLISCGVLQKMKIAKPTDAASPKVTTGNSGMDRSPLPFTVCLTQRLNQNSE